MGSGTPYSYSTPYRTPEREEEKPMKKKFTLSPFMHILIAALCFGAAGGSCQICNVVGNFGKGQISETGIGMAFGFVVIALYVAFVGFKNKLNED